MSALNNALIENDAKSGQPAKSNAKIFDLSCRKKRGEDKTVTITTRNLSISFTESAEDSFLSNTINVTAVLHQQTDLLTPRSALSASAWLRQKTLTSV